jgi:type IV pilus assembly protein PilW
MGKHDGIAQGFSLIELMIGLAVSSIALAAMYGIFISSTKTHTIQQVTVETQQNIRLAMDIMTRDTRMAGFDPDRLANAGFQIIDADQVKFTADRNMNGTIDAANFEEISYFYDAVNNEIEQCLYNDNSTCIPIAENVSACTFQYFDADGNIETNPADVRVVDIRITVQDQAGIYGTVQRDLNTRVLCRNMGLD